MAPLADDKKPIKEAKHVTIDVGDGAAIPKREDVGLFTAWRVAFFGAIAIIVYLAVFRPDPYLAIMKFVPDGILVTFEVTVLSIILALVIGLFTGLGRIAKNPLINGIASLYVEVIRGIPLLVQLFYIYFALGRLIQMPPLPSAVLAMGICYGAYMGEIFRAGIQSIPKGQTEAARSLGMTQSQSMYHVILPQAFKTILPPVGNEFVALLKDSSLVSILAVADLLRRGREFAAESFNYFETYTVVALVYLIITLFLSKLISIMEEKISAG
ncbi:MAG: L-cystine transport system permease protein TcyB [Deltaproteobacteria bacterium ADurb.BinA179]|nr:amino acid ABC transporter permease [Pseudomonadota bacterium]OPZ27504.1 MAG: L-cystine transport system permease protein TcyB [Deltaproteobacteria bacterium ADurb.BinA179]HOD70627.1 amino acid ABC transporter permease [Deltaproteobacteria bacterium]HRR20399.1 amino acid ABC transporter permease [Desulfomonilia bacterium]HOE73155.1 amino acid ABC transporter permease [Deltaproteobacteria bacterium]